MVKKAADVGFPNSSFAYKSAFFRRAELKPACILLLVVTIAFFICPHIFTFAEPAISLSSVKEP